MSDQQDQDQLRQHVIDLIVGRDGVIYTTDRDDHTFEVRRDGKHVGFFTVYDSGEVLWF